VPVPSAQIDLYLQGATASSTVTITTSAAVPVFDCGSLFDTALVQAGAGGPILTVDSVDSPTQVTLQNATGLSVEVAAGTRLILLSARPTAYSNPFALGPDLGSTVTADSGGHAVVFLPEGQYDYVVTDPSTPLRRARSPER